MCVLCVCCQIRPRAIDWFVDGMVSGLLTDMIDRCPQREKGGEPGSLASFLPSLAPRPSCCGCRPACLLSNA